MKNISFASAAVLACSLGLLSFSQPARALERSIAASEAKLQIKTQGSNLAFDKTKLTVKHGQKVSLTFTNMAAKDSGLQHNWVLTKPGTDTEVATAGMSAGPDKNYLPDSPNIIAHTKLLNAGQKETITFDAPAEPGQYPYFCSFPGHATTMKGTLVVK